MIAGSGHISGSGKRFTFPRAYRLTKTDEFSSVFRFGRSRSGRFWQVYFRTTDDGPRLGVVVAKKLARRAVLRNTIKRLARETFRLQRNTLASGFYVVRCRSVFAPPERGLAHDELQRLLGGKA